MTNRIEADGQGFHEFKRQSDFATFPDTFTQYVGSFGDVYFWPKGNFHVVTRAALARKALVDPALSCDRGPFFLSRMPNLDLSLIGDFFSVVSKMMVMSDSKAHQQRRATATAGLSDALIDGYAKEIRPTIANLIETHRNGTHLEFVSGVSSRVPSIILADLFCIPEQERQTFYQWSATMTGFFGGGSGYENADGVRVNEAAVQLREYFARLLRDRQVTPQNDFMTGMLTVAERFAMSEADLISQAVMMLVAGQVTTSDQMNNILYQLLSDRPLWESLQENPERIPAMIEELSRLDPAVTFLFRVAAADTQIGPQPIQKGDTVFISSHCINRDKDIFADAHRVNLQRPSPTGHFTYGFGAHHCMGARLARMEMNHLFRHLVEEFPNLRLGAGPIERDHYSLSFSGFKTLSVELE